MKAELIDGYYFVTSDNNSLLGEKDDSTMRFSKEEFESLRSQIASSNKRGGTRYMPFAFTEQGVAMLSSVLNSESAIEINISIMRAFVTVRQYLSSLNSTTKEIEELKQRMKMLEEGNEDIIADRKSVV